MKNSPRQHTTCTLAIVRDRVAKVDKLWLSLGTYMKWDHSAGEGLHTMSDLLWRSLSPWAESEDKKRVLLVRVHILKHQLWAHIQ